MSIAYYISFTSFLPSKVILIVEGDRETAACADRAILAWGNYGTWLQQEVLPRVKIVEAPASLKKKRIVMVAKKKKNKELKEKDKVKEVCRRIRVARSYWDAHNNAACRGEREKALLLYETLTPEQKEQIPQQLRVWLRYQEREVFRQRQAIMGWRQNAFYTKIKESRKMLLFDNLLSLYLIIIII